MHTITTELVTGIIEVEASGFWTIEHIEEFLRDLEREGRRVLATGKRNMLLCSFSKSAIQPREVIAMLQRVRCRCRSSRARSHCTPMASWRGCR